MLMLTDGQIHFDSKTESVSKSVWEQQWLKVNTEESWAEVM